VIVICKLEKYLNGAITEEILIHFPLMSSVKLAEPIQIRLISTQGDVLENRRYSKSGAETQKMEGRFRDK
jgi:hypothetical protein